MSAPQGPQAERVRVRRSPKILNFLLTGALLGAIVALVLTFAFPANAEYPVSQVFGFLLVLGIVVGAAVGGIFALIFERASQRRAREIGAVREVTAAPPAETDPETPAGPDSASPGAVEGDSPTRP